MPQGISTSGKWHLRRIWILVGVGLLSIACLLSAQLFLKGCVLWSCAPSRNFAAEELGIPLELFPQPTIGGRMHELLDSEGFGAAEVAIQDVYWRGGKADAVYTVARYPSPLEASLMYRASIADNEASGLAACPQFGDLQISANESSISCGEHRIRGFSAVVIARYEEFLVSFVSTIDSEMTFAKFQRLVGFVDDQWRQLLVLAPTNAAVPALCSWLPHESALCRAVVFRAEPRPQEGNEFVALS